MPKPFLLILPILFLCQLAHAQLTVDAKVNVGSLITGGINVQGDFAISERFSVAAGFGYAGNGVEVDGDDYRFRRLRFIPEARYYLTEPRSYLGADGFFLGGYGKLNRIRVQRVTPDGIDETGSVRAVIGALVGYKLVTDGGFVVEVNGGVGTGTLLGGNIATNVAGAVLSSFDARLGVLVGYRFGG